MVSKLFKIMVILALGLGFFIYPVTAQELPKFEVLSMQIVEKVEGVTQTWSTNDPSKRKGIIFLIKVISTSDTIIWPVDLALAYTREDKEDRSACVGVTTMVSSPEDEGVWIFGDYAKQTAKKGTRYFKALFALENNVNEVSLLYMRPYLKSITIKRD